MDVLAIDLETFSSVDLKESGVFKYVESPDFSILLFGYRLNDKAVEVIDLTADDLPEEILKCLTDPDTLKTAFNASFEITCLNAYMKRRGLPELDISQWEDTMLRAAYCGYSGSLDTVAKALGFNEEKRKNAAGTALINRFSKPRKPTAKDKRTRIMPFEDPGAWNAFIEYNRQDVIVESAIREKLVSIEIPEKERLGWMLDYTIQKKGVRIDYDLVRSAMELDKNEKSRLKADITELSGIKNPKSGAQMKEWLSVRFGREITSLTKETVPKLIEEANGTGLTDVVKVLKYRQELYKTSLAKYNKIESMICSDGHVRGILQFYGSRTGRWAGRGVQVQNLPRNSLPAISVARELFKSGDLEGLELIYGSNFSDIASQLIRTVFIPEDGKRFAVADYSAIEARVIAWLAGESWRLDVFKTTGKIYEASAAQMFHVDFEKICDKNAPEHKLRAQGKVAELALGYQGAAGALARMDYAGAIPEEDRGEIVRQWRENSPHIVRLWRECESAALKAIRNPETSFSVNDLLEFRFQNGFLEVRLPSGRSLYYPEVEVGKNSFGRDAFNFLGVNNLSRKLERIYMYGGKIVENIVQAIARDCLAEALLRLKDNGYTDIKFHVHDEIIVEVDKKSAEKDLKKIIQIMCQTPKWADGLPLNAEGFVSDFYKKD